MAALRTERLHIVLHGAVQGNGYRPTIYRIAQKLRLTGWVRNTEAGIEMEVEGTPEQLACFLDRLKSDRPRTAVVVLEEVVRIDRQQSTWFEILPTPKLVVVPAD